MSSPKTNLVRLVQDSTSRKDFSYNKKVENQYASSLISVSKQIEKMLKKYDPNSPVSSLDILQSLREYSEELTEWAKNIAFKLIYNLNEDDKRQWLRQTEMVSQGMRQEIENAPVYGKLQRYMLENVDLIKSMPLKAAQRVQEIIVENIKSGELRAEDLAEKIMSVGNATRGRAQLIARTETARISTGLA